MFELVNRFLHLIENKFKIAQKQHQGEVQAQPPATDSLSAPIMIPVYPAGMPEGGVKRQRGRPKKVKPEDNEQDDQKGAEDAEMTEGQNDGEELQEKEVQEDPEVKDDSNHIEEKPVEQDQPTEAK